VPELRDYQQQNVDELRSAMQSARRVLYVLPTGGGKTVVFSYIAHQASQKGRRVMIVAHRKEIVRQISKALHRFEVPHALVMPGHDSSDRAIQVGMVQTVGRRLSRGWAYKPDLLVTDEAHHAVAGQWAEVAAHWSDALGLGVTATPLRLDGKGLKEQFDTMVRGPSVKWLIEHGYLARFRYLAPPMKVDVSKVHKRYGDYNLKELSEAVDKNTVTGDAVQHYAKYLNGRPSIAFCVSTEHARHVAEQFRASGFRAANVDGAMPAGERDQIIGDFSTGRLNVLTSCDLISEGFDVPAVSGVLLLRPTQSLSMHLQQVGRALRPKEDGGEAIILDHAGNVDRHGLPDADRDWSLEGMNRDTAKVTTCKKCFQVMTPEQAGERRKESNCAVGFFWDQCGLKVSRPQADAAGREVSQVEGELREVYESPAWADGLDVRQARGLDFYKLLQRADTPEKLAEIARARGYKRSWVGIQVRLQRERAGGSQT
jgi:DNA repair protein RadD